MVNLFQLKRENSNNNNFTMLKEVLQKDLKVVFCGTAKGKASATKGFYYAGPGNKG